MLIGSGDGDITVGGVGNTTIGIGAADVSFIDNMATPRPTRMSAMRVSSLTPGATADDAADEILDENTLTPRPGKQQCPKSASSSSGASRSPAAGISFRSAATDNSALLEESELAEEDEDEAVEQILADAQKRFTNMRVNPFTPVKSSKLSQEVKFEAAEANDDDDENGDEQSEESHSHDATPEPRASMQQNPHKHVSFSGKRQTTKTGTVHVEKPIDRAPMAKTATGIPVKTASTLTVKKSMSTIKSVPKPVVVPAIVPATLVPAAPHDKPPKSASAFPAASTTVAFVPAKSVKPLTVPVEFKFSSRTAHRAITSATVLDTKLASTMAKPAAGKRAVEKKLTVPKPFKFHVVTMKKEPTTDTAKSPYVPLAERVLDFTKTTDRLKKTAAVGRGWRRLLFSFICVHTHTHSARFVEAGQQESHHSTVA